jgi:hypothetical protein
MPFMKFHFAGLAIATLLIVGPILPGHAEDAAASKDPVAPAATQTAAPPPSVPRPSLAPKAAEPASPVATVEPAASPRRRTAYRHSRRWGYYRTAYWEPFPIYLPHLYHHRIRWSRVPWIFHF